MTTPRRRRVTQDEPLARLPATTPATVTTPLPTATEERRERELEDLLEEIGTDGRIKVWHVIDGKAVYAGEISHDGFSLDVLLDVFGGGDKSLVFYQGRAKVETIRVSLDPSIPPKNPRTPKAGAAAPGTAAPSGVGDFVPVLTAMMTMNMQSMQQSQQMMTSMVTAMTSLMAARPEKDPTEMALKIAEVLKPQAAPAGGVGVVEMFGFFEKGMNLGAKMGGHEDDPTMSAVNKGLETLGVIVNGYVEDRKAQANARAAEAGRRLSAPPAANDDGGAGTVTRERDGVTDGGGSARERHEATTDDAGAVGNGSADGGAVPQVRPWVDAARPFIGMLIQAASVLSPAQAAETIATRLDDEQFGDLIEDILNQDGGGFGVRIVSYFPAVRKVDPDWLGKVINTLITEHAEFDETDDAPPSSPSAVPPSGNGVTG